MFCTSISKLHSCCYFSKDCQSNFGCLCTGILDLGIVFIGLTLLICISTFLTAIIATCIIAWVMFCSVAIFWDCLVWVCLFFYFLVCLLLLTPCYSLWRMILNVLSVITLSDCICTRAHLYTIILWIHGKPVGLFPCMLFAASCALFHWLRIWQLWYVSSWI